MKMRNVIMLLFCLMFMRISYAQQPYVGEIRLVAFNFVPAGYMPCDGRLISITEYETLFQLIGTTYGGDGVSTFGLPDLRGRVPVGQGTLNGKTYVIGEMGGTETVTLSMSQIPAHTHTGTVSVSNLPASNLLGTEKNPIGVPAVMNKGRMLPYSSVTNAASGTMQANTPANSGGQPVNIMKPYLPVQYVISLYGLFPSQTK